MSLASKANVTASGKQYPLLPSIGARPVPNALKPHIQRGRSGSQHSRGDYQTAQPENAVGLSLDSKVMSQFTKQSGRQSRSTRANALPTDAMMGRSTISAGRRSRQAARMQGFFSSTQLANNVNLGRLPTLGLNQIKLEEFQDQDNNLFRIQPNTEKMLVARELEREFKDLNKFDKSNLRVWEKGISTRIDRAGTIRVVNGIPAFKPEGDRRRAMPGGVSADRSQEDFLAAQGKQKLNIFDVQDGSVMKQETIGRLGYDEKSLVPAEDQQSAISHSSRLSQSQISSEVGKARAVEYLNKGRQQTETVRDFIEGSRKILMAQISINQKTEETELLKEYIIMEKDKLEEGKKTFVEDREKYEKFKMDLTAKSQQTEDEGRKVQKKIEDLTQLINDLKKQEAEQLSKESKLEEEIVQHKASKRFLDLLAIASKNKKPINQKKRRREKLAAQQQNLSDGDADSSHEQNFKSGGDGNTFMTQVSGTTSQAKQQRFSKNTKSFNKASFVKSQGTVEEDDLRPSQLSAEKVADAEQDETDDEYKNSDIDLNADYSDDDDQIRIGEKDLVDYLQKLEENNLFKMNLIQESQQTLEKIEKECESTVDQKRAIITDVDSNLSLLQASKQQQMDKLAYYKGVLDQSAQRQGEESAQGQRSLNKSQTQKGQKATGKRDGKQSELSGGAQAEAVTTSALQLSATQNVGIRGKSQVQTVFNAHLQSLGASREEIKRINDTIRELVDRAQIKQEDMSDKIGLLKKIEIKFQHLVEMRKVFAFFDSRTLLAREKEIKDKVSIANYEARRLRDEEAFNAQAAKTLQKIEGKRSLKVSKNIRMTQRSKKPELKIQNTVKDKDPPEVEEMRRYLGQMPENWEAEMFKQPAQHQHHQHH